MKSCLQPLAGFSNGGGRNPKQDGLLRDGELEVGENGDTDISFGEPEGLSLQLRVQGVGHVQVYPQGVFLGSIYITGQGGDETADVGRT